VSNVETLNQTIYFDTMGTAIPLTPGKKLVRPISITGERGAEYLHTSAPTANAHTGRYRFCQERCEIDPAHPMRGTPDRYANVRLLLSDGTLANGVNAGAITTFLKKVALPILEIRNVTMTAGGTDGESFVDARQRFAEALLSRQRVLTHADLESIIKAFAPKVRAVQCQPGLERLPGGLQRVHRITVGLDRRAFTSSDEEASLLQRELEDHLQQRAVLGLAVRVAVAWV
jgi:hypothetical protein